jgi:hypothetical protein
MSKPEILSRFPPKPTADILVSRFFNTYDPGIHIIHGPTFQKEYDKHWLSPEETPVIWLGLVYAMMCIALQSYTRAGDEPPEYSGKSWEMSKEYRDLTAQCLVMADITQPTQGMLETLILHVHAEYARSRDAEVGILISTGIICTIGDATRNAPGSWTVPWYLCLPGRDATACVGCDPVIRSALLSASWYASHHTA